MNLGKLLDEFALRNKMKNKGALCVALVVTRHAKDLGLPLGANQLLTSAGGQVMGLGKSAVQAILNDHGIYRILAEEGGRTSRGSVGNMKKYVTFLNKLNAHGTVDLEAIESWWIDQVNKYFSKEPFILHFDPSKSLRFVIQDLLLQAQKRQQQSPGSTFAGTMLQHLVGAKLDLLIPSPIKHFGASVADDQSGRDYDFIIEDVAIHVTISPSEALLRKCQRNLNNGLKPVVITSQRGTAVVEALSDQAGYGDRLDIFEAEQFLAGNLYELGKFALTGRRTTIDQLINTYNKIIDECETDPSLKILVSK
ncbi:conserved hypothetical protein [Candidatus Zixiibacteriota bacterium]|nr:conserved hypothetical protein [candidate division Zixibacteria bacterium]